MLQSYCKIGLLGLLVLLLGCEQAWNNPYPNAQGLQNVVYTEFGARPKHLDPAQSYSSDEYEFIAQIYEPPLQYHLLKRPYELIALTARIFPYARYYTADHEEISDPNTSGIAYSEYEIDIKPGIKYQPHPAFAKNEQGKPLYHHLQPKDLSDIHKLSDYEHSDTRELKARDYVYQIKRLAHPQLHSPIFSVMAEYIVGLNDYAQQLKQHYADLVKKSGHKTPYLDLDAFDFEGATVVDDYRYRIKVKGKYPQMLYWLAMPFFAPMPREADVFYSQPGMAERNISLDWYPVGTGPYMLTVNNPNRQMILTRNPNFHGETYPTEGDAGDAENGLLQDAGKPLPFVDQFIFVLEKESIPYWNKFLQGYYDFSGVSSESFDQVVNVGSQGEIGLSEEMKKKGIQLATSVQATTVYLGFNMLDPIVGGQSEKAQKLRQAISIALDYEEFITIFRNGRGIPAQGPLPPGIFGFSEGESGINPYVYEWKNSKAQRRSLATAQQLLAEAGYANGVNSLTGEPLVLNYDVSAVGPESKVLLEWFRKQFQKLNIQLLIRDTDYNRFQEKIRSGNAQIFQWGWNADYPDPENFFFLLYGPNGKKQFKGENAVNYHNPHFDRLFEQMKNMENSPARQAIINNMVVILQKDAPWIWGFHPVSFGLFHEWFYNIKPNVIANNTLKYRRVDPVKRYARRLEWNQAVLWPVVAGFVILLLSSIPASVSYWRREHGLKSSHLPRPS